MFVCDRELILSKGSAKLTEAQVHGPDDGILFLYESAKAFDDSEIAHALTPFPGRKAPTRPAMYWRSWIGASKKARLQSHQSSCSGRRYF